MRRWFRPQATQGFLILHASNAHGVMQALIRLFPGCRQT
jgi:hypothetical protein